MSKVRLRIRFISSLAFCSLFTMIMMTMFMHHVLLHFLSTHDSSSSRVPSKSSDILIQWLQQEKFVPLRKRGRRSSFQASSLQLHSLEKKWNEKKLNCKQGGCFVEDSDETLYKSRWVWRSTFKNVLTTRRNKRTNSWTRSPPTFDWIHSGCKVWFSCHFLSSKFPSPF